MMRAGSAFSKREGRVDAFVDGAADMLSYAVARMLKLRR